ncbi:MAG: hypothetical protein ACRC2O_03130 [Chitinophagaceae bacterium]
MATKMKVCKKAILPEQSAVSFTFTNDKVLIVEWNKIPANNQALLGLFGINHKIGDSYANAANVDEAYDTAVALTEALYNGDWSIAKESTGGITIEALSRLLGKTIEECKAAWEAQPEDVQKVMAKDPKLVSMVAEIRLERAKAKLATATDGIDLAGLFTKPESE